MVKSPGRKPLGQIAQRSDVRTILKDMPKSEFPSARNCPRPCGDVKTTVHVSGRPSSANFRPHANRPSPALYEIRRAKPITSLTRQRPKIRKWPTCLMNVPSLDQLRVRHSLLLIHGGIPIRVVARNHRRIPVDHRSADLVRCAWIAAEGTLAVSGDRRLWLCPINEPSLYPLLAVMPRHEAVN